MNKIIISAVFLYSLMALSCGTTKKAITATPPTVTEVKAEKEAQVVTEEKENTTIEKVVDATEKVAEKSTTPEQKEVKVSPEIIEEDKASAEAFNHNAWDLLLQKHVSNSGIVDYKGFKEDRAVLKAYLDELATNLPEDNWTREDKLAYWINVYNAYTVKLIIDNYPIKSIKDIKDPWGKRFFKLGSKWYNLNDVEHQILRKMNEPRIHFAIVCASISCPKLENRAFYASNLEERLTSATKAFLNDASRNNISENSLKISKIFKWFTKDFKQNNGSLATFINTYTDIEIAKNAKISYNDYNWNLNE